MKILDGIKEMEKRWMQIYRHPLLPAPSVCVGMIEGGNAPSMVPDQCMIRGSMRCLPEAMDKDVIIKDLIDTVAQTAKGDAWMEKHPPKVTITQVGNSAYISEDSEQVACFDDSYKKVTGKKLVHDGFNSGSDARSWFRIGGMPVLTFGPGNISTAHCIDEWIEVDKYIEAIEIYEQFILDWCK